MLLRMGSLFCATLLGMGGASFWADGADQDQSPKVSITPRKEAPSGRSSNLRLDVNVVLVPVTVTDPFGKPVKGLSVDRFRVLEDGIQQKVTSFLREEAPVSLGLLFDSSSSMKNRIDASVEALKLLFQSTGPGDEYFVVQFADQARLLGGFTDSPDEIHGRLGYVQAKGWTALLDAVAMGAHQMKFAKNGRRVLLVLSDGNDNNSRFSESEIKSMVIESDLRIYAIALAYRPRLLQQLADETGGNVLVAQNVSELPDVVQRLTAEIRSQYLLGYTPSNPHNDGKYHKVKIDILQAPGSPPVRASWRRGYYAPRE
ncbi:MAG TPA: VWA domain-containing protein [Bryobacteraceae bacterium]